MIASKRIAGLYALALFLIWSVANVGSAQAPAASEETWNLFVGEMIEILPIHEVSDPKFGWVLIKDATQTVAEQFIEGSTSSFYRYRPIQPARYTLYGDISSADGSQHIQRTFHFIVKARDTVPSTASSESGSGTQLVRTDPKLQEDGAVVLGQDKQSIRVTPIDLDLKNIAFDADIQTDADGEGNPSNDIQDKNTFFQQNSTPIFLWMAVPGFNSRDVSFTAVPENGNGAIVQNMKLVSFDYAKNNNLLTSAVTIQTKTASGGTIAFTPVLDKSFPNEVPLIYRWTFGDGEESLETQPTHAYGAPGTYTVSLQVRNLTNGREVATQSQEVQVTEQAIASSASSATSATSSVSSTAPVSRPTGDFFAQYRTVLIALAVLLGSVLLGAVVIFLLSRLKRGNSLDEHLARMEQNILQKEKTKVLEGGAAPMSIPATVVSTPASSDAQPKNFETDAQRKRAENEVSAAVPTPANLSINEEKAPSWLKKGLAPETAAASKPDAKPDAIPAPVAVPEKKPEPSVVSVTDEALPDWLKPSPSAAVQPVATPTEPKLAPEKKSDAAKVVETKPEAPVTPAAEPAPKSLEDNLPDWLKPSPAAPAAVVVAKPEEKTPAPAPEAKPQTTPEPAPVPVSEKKLEAPKPVETKPVETPATPATPVTTPVVAKETPKPQQQNQPRQDNRPPRPQNPQQTQPRPPKPQTTPQQQTQPNTPKKDSVPATATPAPVQAPAAVMPKPVEAKAADPTPTPAPTVVPEVKPAAPKPVEQKPVEALKPIEPQPVETASISAPKPGPEPMDILPAEEPIAFIRAESLNPSTPIVQPPKPQNPQA